MGEESAVEGHVVTPRGVLRDLPQVGHLVEEDYSLHTIYYLLLTTYLLLDLLTTCYLVIHLRDLPQVGHLVEEDAAQQPAHVATEPAVHVRRHDGMVS